MSDFSTASIEDEAARCAGVGDGIGGSYREGLERLVGEIGALRILGETGRAALREIAVRQLANRLRIHAWHGTRPALGQAPVPRPLFILGLPRTGSTLVSNLLAADPRRRTLLNWEAHDSVPPPTAVGLRTDRRVAARQAGIGGPAAESAFKTVHAENADSPTECHSLTKQDFRALWWESQLPLPDYADWMLNGDMVPAYLFHRRALQMLQSEAPGIWSLKMPSHALHIEALLQVYPDARLVWTHRDPYVATASLCSMIRTVQARWIAPDIGWIASHYPAQAAAHANRLMRVREELGEERIHDLHYADLVADPIGAMRRLYARLGDPFEPELERGMRAWLAANPQGKFGRHSYSLDAFGLGIDDLRPLFADYLARHAVAMEGAG